MHRMSCGGLNGPDLRKKMRAPSCKIKACRQYEQQAQRKIIAGFDQAETNFMQHALLDTAKSPLGCIEHLDSLGAHQVCELAGIEVVFVWHVRESLLTSTYRLELGNADAGAVELTNNVLRFVISRILLLCPALWILRNVIS